MTYCFLFKIDITHRITGIPKDLILNTYYDKNSEYVISNAIEKDKRSDILFGVKGYIVNFELNNKYSLATIIRNDNYLDKVKTDIANNMYTYETMPMAIQINLNNFNHLNRKNAIEVFKSRDKNGVVEEVKWKKYHISFRKIYKKYKRGLELSKLEKELLILRLRKIEEIKELLILRLRKIEEIDKIAKGDVELMEVANKIKELSLDINTIGLYDEEEEREKMMNSLRAEGETIGEKKGAKEREKAIAKSMLAKNMDISLISELTGLTKKQLANLV